MQAGWQRAFQVSLSLLTNWKIIREFQGVTAEIGANSLPVKPVVPVEESVRDGEIVCLMDGHARKMLRHYIMVKYKMRPDDYRTYFRLPADYPMTAPGHAAEKSAIAAGAASDGSHDDPDGDSPRLH